MQASSPHPCLLSDGWSRQVMQTQQPLTVRSNLAAAATLFSSILYSFGCLAFVRSLVDGGEGHKNT